MNRRRSAGGEAQVENDRAVERHDAYLRTGRSDIWRATRDL
jgi:hypothetical protein